MELEGVTAGELTKGLWDQTQSLPTTGLPSHNESSSLGFKGWSLCCQEVYLNGNPVMSEPGLVPTLGVHPFA